MEKTVKEVSKVDGLGQYIINHTSFLCVTLSSNLKIITINPAVEILYRATQETIIDKPYFRLFKTDKLLRDFFKEQHYSQDWSKAVYLESMPKPDFYVSWNINKILNKFGEIEFLLFGHDISKEKLAEKRARDILFSYETMIAHLPGNVYWMDTKCKHLGCNDNVLKMLGLTREQYIGSSYEKLAKIAGWTEGQGESFKTDDLEVIRTGKPKFNIEEPLLPHKDGKVYYYLTNRVPMYNQSGKIVGVAGISIDITERKEAEKQLKAAKEKAEAAMQAKSQFLANMSHDFLTPISIIMNGVEAIISHGNDKNKILEYSQDIKFAGNTLLGYVQDVLETAQLQYSETTIKHQLFDLKSLARSINKTFSAIAVKKGISLRLVYSKKCPKKLVGDEHRIRRVINNLISNAIKFTHNGEIVVKIGIKTVGSNLTKLTLSVKDTGIGIPQNKLKEIFERFTRLEPAFKGHYKGMGLGLSIVKEFIDQLGGKITVKSQLSKGSLFQCEIPCTLPDKTLESLQYKEIFNPAKELNQVELAKEDNKNLSNLKILIIEDDALIQKFNHIVLSNFNCEIDTSSTASEGINKITNNSYDLILLDIGLPDADGFHVINKIRNLEKENQQKPRKVIALTAHATIMVDTALKHTGFDGFYSKPLTKELFIKICNDLSLIKNDTILRNSDEKKFKDCLVNLESASKIFGGNKELARKAINMFIKQAPTYIEAIDEAYQTGDNKLLASLVHKAKGGVSYCGISELYNALSNLEKIILDNKPRNHMEKGKSLVITLLKQLINAPV